MDMYQKRKIRAENKKIIVKKVFQKSTFRGILVTWQKPKNK